MDTIPRSTLVKAVALLGYEPNDVASVMIWPKEIIVTLFERDEHGRKIITPDGPKKRTEVCNVSA